VPHRLEVHSLISYPSFKDTGIEFNDSEWRCQKLIKAYKNKSFKGFFTLKINGSDKYYREEDTRSIVKILNKKIAKKLLTLSDSPVTIVPVPNRQATANIEHDFRTWELARAIASRMDNGSLAVDALRWTKPQNSASEESGTRNSRILVKNLKFSGSLDGPVVLFDDVLTTGGHLKAAAQKLAEHGVNVQFAIVCGRTIWERSAPMIEWQSETLEWLNQEQKSNFSFNIADLF